MALTPGRLVATTGQLETATEMLGKAWKGLEKLGNKGVSGLGMVFFGI